MIMQRKGWIVYAQEKRILKNREWLEIETLFESILKKIANLKTLLHDWIHGFWAKQITSIHEKLAQHLRYFLQDAKRKATRKIPQYKPI